MTATSASAGHHSLFLFAFSGPRRRSSPPSDRDLSSAGMLSYSDYIKTSISRRESSSPSTRGRTGARPRPRSPPSPSRPGWRRRSSGPSSTTAEPMDYRWVFRLLYLCKCIGELLVYVPCFLSFATRMSASRTMCSYCILWFSLFRASQSWRRTRFFNLFGRATLRLLLDVFSCTGSYMIPSFLQSLYFSLLLRSSFSPPLCFISFICLILYAHGRRTPGHLLINTPLNLGRKHHFEAIFNGFCVSGQCKMWIKKRYEI